MIKVQGARVLIKRLPVPETTASGLFLLGREYPLVGEVLAVGNGARGKNGQRKPIADLEAGDMVQFRRETKMDTREVADDTFILDYDACLMGIRREGEQYRTWAVGNHVLVRPT